MRLPGHEDQVSDFASLSCWHQEAKTSYTLSRGALFSSPKQVVFMSGLTLNVVYASLGIAGLIALACVADLIWSAPFGGQTMYDVLFMIASGITIYMGLDCLKEN